MSVPGWTADDYLAVAFGLAALAPLFLAWIVDEISWLVRRRHLDGTWGCAALIVGLWLGLAGMIFALR